MYFSNWGNVCGQRMGSVLIPRPPGSGPAHPGVFAGPVAQSLLSTSQTGRAGVARPPPKGPPEQELSLILSIAITWILL